MFILLQRVTLIRKSKGLSVYALEKGSVIGLGTLKSWNKSIPSGDKILRVANFLDVSVDYLLGNTDNPQSHKNNPQDLAAAAEKLAEAARALSAAAGAASDKIQSDIREILDICHVSTTEMPPEKNQGENIRP